MKTLCDLVTIMGSVGSKTSSSITQPKPVLMNVVAVEVFQWFQSVGSPENFAMVGDFKVSFPFLSEEYRSEVPGTRERKIGTPKQVVAA